MWNLQTLYGVALDQTIASLFSNNIFPNLRTLGLEYNSQKDNNKSLLSRLKLHCGGSCLSSDAITAFPPSLIKITFSKCDELDSRAMNSLGQLSNLQSLTIHSGSYEAPLSCGATGDNFSQLQVLILEDSFGYRWGVLEGSARMPPLGCVVIKYCHGVSELPQELWSLTSLQKVHIVGPSEQFENSLRNVKLNNDCKLTSFPFTSAPPPNPLLAPIVGHIATIVASLKAETVTFNTHSHFESNFQIIILSFQCWSSVP
ncbi:hypothetical protein PIB30_040685 [Stylosanthes scabra]|uniref:Uncharacterized protein n=1 Tax=Stylosanthes scabra TaxID=79078 RepID=A0ABU6QE82_9FABA|nr:hypothetical protein [Stylosanthes scabra]